jgi:hypothetical protein
LQELNNNSILFSVFDLKLPLIKGTLPDTFTPKLLDALCAKGMLVHADHYWLSLFQIKGQGTYTANRQAFSVCLNKLFNRIKLLLKIDPNCILLFWLFIRGSYFNMVFDFPSEPVLGFFVIRLIK